MDKVKVAFLAVAAVAVLAAAGLGFAAKMKYDGAAEARSERDGKVSSLERIYRGDIFPNAENVEAMDGVLKEYEETLAAFTNELAKANIGLGVGGEMSPSAFQSKLSDVVRTLQGKAPLVDGRKSVPNGFAFGFEAYFGRDTMPGAEEVPLLMQQLTITTMLSLQAYGSELSQITKIERDARDKATLELRQGGDRRAAQPEEEEQPRRRGKKQRVVEEKRAPLFTSQPMVMEFTARQNALADFLNRLNGIGRPFVVVKSISAKKTGDDLRKPPAVEAQDGARREPREPRDREARGRSRGERGEREPREARGRGRRDRDDSADAGQAAPAAPKPSEMPPELRVVSGPDVDPPLSVRLELEIFNFGVEAE